jgi:hypothetical protein
MAAIFRGRVKSAQPPAFFSQHFKKEYNLIISQNFKLLGYTCWPLDFAMGIQYFTDIELSEVIFKVYKKYEKEPFQVFPCELLMLGIYYNKLVTSDEQQLVKEKDILELIKSYED